MAKLRKTYGAISYEPVRREWVVHDFPPQLSLKIKDIFRRISKTETGKFSFPDDPLHCFELLWFMDRYPLRVAKDDLARLKRGRKAFMSEQADIENLMSGEASLTQYPGLAEGCELWVYQQIAVEMFRIRGRMLLGDDIGLGKTNTAIGCMLTPGSLPCAVVCEVHVMDQWAERIREFSNLKVHVISKATAYPLPSADVYIFSYSRIDGWVDVVAHGAGVTPEVSPRTWPETAEQYAERVEQRRKQVEKATGFLPDGRIDGGFFKMLVWDEPQSLRGGYSTEKGKAAKVFVESIGKILGLTATPVMNYGIEMFNVMQFITPGVLGTRDEFIREWCEGDDKRVGDPDALGAYLRDISVMLRRTEEDVGRTMPQPNVLTHYVSFDEKQAERNEELAYTLAIRSQSGSFIERGSAFRQLDALTRMSTGLAKAAGVAEYVRILLEADVPVLLSGWHREVYEIWMDELRDWKPLLYTGTETTRVKERNKNAFIAGDSNLLIISNRSGAGLDGLQARCQDFVAGELDWSPMILKQLIGRLRRYGQDEVVNAHYMIANGGSDPLMVETLGLKSSQSHGIMNPFEQPKASTHDTSRMQRLAEMVIERRKQKLAGLVPDDRVFALAG
jgi:Superfamily II DNA/RNA helicases, SNF2 family